MTFLVIGNNQFEAFVSTELVNFQLSSVIVGNCDKVCSKSGSKFDDNILKCTNRSFSW